MHWLLRSLVSVGVVVALIAPSGLTHATHRGTVAVEEDKRVTNVWDGDTFEVNFDINNDGVIDKGDKVRMIGIQAMELQTYQEGEWDGHCNGDDAAARLHELIDGNAPGRDGERVNLTYMAGNDTGLKNRPLRWVATKQPDGSLRDIGRVMLREGMALWFPHRDQYLKNVIYQRAALAARADGLGIWNPTGCDGPGPQQTAQVKLYINWDADGVDKDNVNGEYVRIQNTGSETLQLGGWLLRESALLVDHSVGSELRQYPFPQSGCAETIQPSPTCARVPAGKYITVHAGQGLDTATNFYWGNTEPIFENAATNGAGHGDGDGVYLFDDTDETADLRFSAMYPCLKKACPDVLKGHVRVSHIQWNPEGRDTAASEFVTIKIAADGPASADLQGYVLESWPYSYMFGYNSVLNKGETMKVVVGGDAARSGRLTKYWGIKNTIFSNQAAGDTARIRTHDNIVLHCRSYLGGSCSNVTVTDD